MFQKKSALELEWEKLQKKEQKFLLSREQKKDSMINQKLEEKVPVKLQETLCKAFSKAFGKKAEGSGKINLAVSGAVGVGMGIFGIGIPDIPVFTGMVLKSIYEIALNYGFSYETIEERRFILLLIEGAVSCGQEMLDIDAEIDRFIENNRFPICYDEKIQIEKTAAGLSKELLYMKFLQGIPIVGAVGGIYDAVYMKRITEYVNLKYKKRFLMQKKQ